MQSSTQYFLDGMEQRLRQGMPLVLFHGTTEPFASFDLRKSRRELVDAYYGEGIFFTPSKDVAVKYATAARNAGISPSVIQAMGARHPQAAKLLALLVSEGRDVWDHLTVVRAEKMAGGYDVNDLIDLSKHIRGSKYADAAGEQEEIRRALFGGDHGVPQWVFGLIERLGIDPAPFSPKVYTVEARLERPLWTPSSTKARGARKAGYDSVIFYGRALVSGVPEVAVFDPAKLRITAVEVLE